MAREISISKRAKISQAQQLMLISVLGASVVLGLAVALSMHFFEVFSFNINVITEEDKAINSYSKAIENIGICKKPAGSTYTTDELKACNPNNTSLSSVSNSLRAKILENMASNEYLASVPKEDSSTCKNAEGKSYTYKELQENYEKAETTDEVIAATNLIQNCSALRIIPDALPSYKNEEALLASLNKIFLLSGYPPESLSPTGNSGVASFGNNLNTISVRLSVQTTATMTRKVLDNIEHSIREFNIERATIEWSGSNALSLQAQATAYYTTPSTLVESEKSIKPGDKK